MKLTIRRFNWMFVHRWLGLITCVGILLWGISGISHPIMTHLQPTPVAFSAPNTAFNLKQAHSLQSILSLNAIKTAQHISLAHIAEQDYFRISVADHMPAHYFDTHTGIELADADSLYAQQLALHFTGKTKNNISKVELITQFSDDYHAVNRILPVWRVEFAGSQHLRAFIDTEQSRLSTLVDDRRYWLTKLFQFGHNWSFLQSYPRLQLILASMVLVTVLSSALSGLYLYFKNTNAKQRLTKQPLRRWHRRLGLIVSITALIFASSGMFHLLMSYQQQAHALSTTTESADLTQLNADAWQKIINQPVAKLDLISHAHQLYWLVLPASPTGENQMPIAQVAALAQEAQHAEHHHHEAHAPTVQPYLLNADNQTTTVMSIENLAILQATSIAKRSSSQVKGTQWINSFANEYGFIFKRLPVIKVQMNDAQHTRYYIEPATGVLAAQIRDIDGLEGFTFSYLHKWNFQSLNKDFRDILASLFALANIMVAIMGLVLFTRRL